MKIIKLNLLLLLLVGSLDVLAAPDPYYDLKRSIGRTLESELKPEIDRFLTRQTLHPHHPFKMRVFIQLGQENLSEFAEVRNEFGPASFIRAARVNVRLGFLPKDPALDVQLRAFVLGYFEAKGYARQKSFSRASSPIIMSYVTVAPQVLSRQSEILAILPKVAIASLCLLFLYLLRSTYRDRRRPMPPHANQGVAPVHVPRVQMAATPHGQTMPIPQQSRPPSPPLPPSEQFNRNYGDPHLRINPNSGSWYINSLSDASIGEIQAAFMRMPFEEVLAVMNSFPVQQRMRVLNSLNLHPAILQRLQEAMQSRS